MAWSRMHGLFRQASRPRMRPSPRPRPLQLTRYSAMAQPAHQQDILPGLWHCLARGGAKANSQDWTAAVRNCELSVAALLNDRHDLPLHTHAETQDEIVVRELHVAF